MPRVVNCQLCFYSAGKKKKTNRNKYTTHTNKENNLQLTLQNIYEQKIQKKKKDLKRKKL
jgi:hypothetical protein